MLGMETLSIRRFDASTIGSDGRGTQTYTDSTIRAVVQPLSGAEAQQALGGERQRDAKTIFSYDAVRVADQYTGTLADRVQIDGVWYEAARVDRHRTGLKHYESIVVRVNEAL